MGTDKNNYNMVASCYSSKYLLTLAGMFCISAEFILSEFQQNVYKKCTASHHSYSPDLYRKSPSGLSPKICFSCSLLSLCVLKNKLKDMIIECLAWRIENDINLKYCFFKLFKNFRKNALALAFWGRS